MVKVQKPTPKTLSNVGKVDKSASKKIKKEVKTKGIVAGPGHALQAKKHKAELVKKTVKKAEVVAPEKENKTNNKMKKTNAGKNVAAPFSALTPIAEKNNKQSKKRPAVLAPAATPDRVPGPVAPVPVGGKSKNNKLRKAAIIGPVAIASVETSSAKKGKKNKKLPKTDAKKIVATKPKQIQELTKNQKKKASIKAFKKQQLLNKKSGKGKEERAEPEPIFEPIPFDEDKFKAILNIENVKKIGAALKTQAEKQVATKKTSIFSDYRYSLNIVSFKIANCPRRMVKLSLKHSLVDKEDDVVIIVPDLKRGSKVDFDPTIQHYEDMFREAGVEGLKIIPFNQLKTEFNTFETLRKLARTYDYFLCDGRLVGQTVGHCGKTFQKPRTVFHAVRLEDKFLKNNIEKALRRTAYTQLRKGNLISIPIGNHKYTMQQLAENVDHVVAQLKKIFPGGLSNVRGLHLKIDIPGTDSLPLYISMAQAPTDTPYVVGPREQRMIKLKKEANEVLSKFAMTKDTKIIKLTNEQVENKRQIKEARAALGGKTKETSNDDGEDSAVPAKKSKKEEKSEVVEKDSKKKSGEEQAEPEDDSDEDAADDSDDEDGDVADDSDDDEDDEEDGGNAEVDEDDDDDDEDNEEDDDDEDGDDDEDDDEEEDSD